LRSASQRKHFDWPISLSAPIPNKSVHFPLSLVRVFVIPPFIWPLISKSNSCAGALWENKTGVCVPSLDLFISARATPAPAASFITLLIGRGKSLLTHSLSLCCFSVKGTLKNTRRCGAKRKTRAPLPLQKPESLDGGDN
jgi:hypothetical protein